jgi:hypothetical protein
VIPNIRDSLLASLGNLSPSHLLDKDLWDFKTPATLSSPLPLTISELNS